MINIDIETIKTNSIKEFLNDWAEWQFNPSIFLFQNNEAKMNIPKYLYDYLFLEHFKINVPERTRRRIDWSPELEPEYGKAIKYDTPYGSFIFNRGL